MLQVQKDRLVALDRLGRPVLPLIQVQQGLLVKRELAAQQEQLVLRGRLV